MSGYSSDSSGSEMRIRIDPHLPPPIEPIVERVGNEFQVTTFGFARTGGFSDSSEWDDWGRGRYISPTRREHRHHHHAGRTEVFENYYKHRGDRTHYRGEEDTSDDDQSNLGSDFSYNTELLLRDHIQHVEPSAQEETISSASKGEFWLRDNGAIKLPLGQVESPDKRTDRYVLHSQYTTDILGTKTSAVLSVVEEKTAATPPSLFHWM